MRLFLDFETFSHLKLGQGGHGLGRYSRHPSTECLMLAWAFDKEDVQQVEWAPGAGRSSRMLPRQLLDALRDPAVTKSAWNAAFEIQVFKHVLGLDIDVSQWSCSMVLAMSLSFPGSLDRVGQIIGLPGDKKKDSRGKALIRKFCGMQKPSKKRLAPFRLLPEEAPAEWAEFLSYNRQDIEAERAIWRRLRRWDMPQAEWEMWHLDQRINEAGIPINRRRVENALRLVKEFTDSTVADLREVTGLRNPNSTQQLLPWLKGRGYAYNDLKKGHVKKALEEVRGAPERHWLFPEMPGKDHVLEYVLEARAEISKSSTKKFAAIINALDEDDLLRFCLQFAGAQRTWRWAGRILQPQNLPRPPKALEALQQALAVAVEHAVTVEELVAQFIRAFPDHKYVKPLMALLAAVIRPTIEAPDGYLFADVDLNAIENRVLGWLSGDDTILDVFKNKRDPYINFATYLYGQSYDLLWHEYKVLGDGTKRTLAKPGELGCGYALSAGFAYEDEDTGETVATGLLGYAWNMGIKLDQAMAQKSVDVWREVHHVTVDYWYELERAMRRCIEKGVRTEARHVRFEMDGPFCRMILPSERRLSYCRPKVKWKMMPWGKEKQSIFYEGLDDKDQWTEISTHAGKVTENADQAISRDLLVNGMKLAAREGLDIRLHVHDQIVALVPEDRAEDSLETLRTCMMTQPKWAPDLPLGAGGHLSKVFIKG